MGTEHSVGRATELAKGEQQLHTETEMVSEHLQSFFGNGTVCEHWGFFPLSVTVLRLVARACPGRVVYEHWRPFLTSLETYCPHTHSHTHAHVHAHTRTHTHAPTHTHTHTHKHSHTQTHAHTHTQTYTLAHTHPHTKPFKNNHL